MPDRLELGGPLTATIERTATGNHVVLKGYLNEATKLEGLTKLGGPMLIDLAGLDRINSIGVKTWTEWVRDCERAGMQLTFERCSPVVVQHLTMISNFLGARPRVKSLYIVYACPSCYSEREELVELTPGVAPTIAASLPCTKCNTPMPLDDLEQIYAESFAQSLAT